MRAEWPDQVRNGRRGSALRLQLIEIVSSNPDNIDYGEMIWSALNITLRASCGRFEW
jgi:hypothetical protein